jgi:hypothetical protein
MAGILESESKKGVQEDVEGFEWGGKERRLWEEEL